MRSWKQHVLCSGRRCMSASAHSAYCRGNAIRNQATMAVVTVPNSSGNSVSHMLPTVVMRSCSTMLRHHVRNVLQPTRGFKRRCASTTSRVCPDANDAQGVGPSKHAILDVTVIEPFACGGLDDFLATRRLIRRRTMSLMPAHFLAQALRIAVRPLFYPGQLSKVELYQNLWWVAFCVWGAETYNLFPPRPD